MTKTITKKQFAALEFENTGLTVKDVRRFLRHMSGLRIVATDGFGPYTIERDGLYLHGEARCDGKNLWAQLINYIADEKTIVDIIDECDWDGDVVRALESFGLLAHPLPRLRCNTMQVDTAIAYVRNELGNTKAVALSSTHIGNEAMVLFSGDLSIVVNGTEVITEASADDFYNNI